jgi:hypothetical protein
MTTTTSTNNAFVPIYAFQAKDQPSDGKITKEWLQADYSKRVKENKKPNWFQERSFIEVAGAVLGLGGIAAWIASYVKETKVGKWISGTVSLGGIGAVIIGLLNAVDLNKSDSLNGNQTIQTETTEHSSSAKQITAKDFYSRLDYSDVYGQHADIGDNGRKYAEALAKTANAGNADEIERVSKELRAKFNAQMESIGQTPGESGRSESWALWDIGKQLYLFENQSESSGKYRLANPLTDAQLQEEIVYRMIGWEIAPPKADKEPPYHSYEYTEIGRKAVQEIATENSNSPTNFSNNNLDTEIKELVLKFKDHDRKALDRIIEIGKPAVEALIIELQSKECNSFTRSFAAEALGRIRDPKAVNPLINILNKDENFFVRSCAAGALGNIGDLKAIDPLIDALKDEYLFVRSSAAEALGNIGDFKAVDPLINALKDEESLVRLLVAKALGDIRDHKALEALETVSLTDKDETVKREAKIAIARIKNPKDEVPVFTEPRNN